MLSACSLAGEWGCELDPADEGVSQEWFARCLAGSILLPGSLPAQGLGEDVTVETKWTGTIFDRSYFEQPAYAKYRQAGNIKVPFWLQPEKQYVGAAWFQREIDIPVAWFEKRVVLALERPHWQTRVWLDAREIGGCDSLSAPHEIHLGTNLLPGRHRLTIRVDNRLHIEVGENAHSVSDHTQGNWNGIVGYIELRATEASWIEDLQVYPHVSSRSITVRGMLGGPKPEEKVALRIVRRNDGAGTLVADRIIPVNGTDGNGGFETKLSLGADAATWDEFHPALYQLTATITGQSKTVLFGLREVSAEGTQFTINGAKVFLRGTLECCVHPLTGYPPTDVESWRAILRTIKAHGLNHVRFHSWCPPEAAFAAGDELGVYFQVECAAWPNSAAVLAFNSPAGIGDGNKIDAWAFSEGERILRAYGNHPCFLLMACGNEPGGPHHKDYLSGWVRHFRERDTRRLYTGAAGWPELPENQFQVIPEPRIHQWGDGLQCRINGQPPATAADYRDVISKRQVPVIAHEIGQWCSYPPLGDVNKYRGHLKARNYQIFAESLDAHHMADQAGSFLYASGKLQALCYKEEIESALRTPGFAGFQLLGLQDFPGQGTAPVGMLDAFWESKGYIDAQEMRRFCNSTVILARFKKRVFTTDEILEAEIQVAHFGPAPLENAVTSWKLVSEDQAAFLQGNLIPCTIPAGNLTVLGDVCIALDALQAPARIKLVLSIVSQSGTYENDWDVWLYPSKVDMTAPPGVAVTSSVPDALAMLDAGGTVLLFVEQEKSGGDIALGFSPVFWNTSCTQNQPPHTLGILCDPNHPVFADFPTDPHSNWQWWHLIKRAKVLNLDKLPANIHPLVQVIDDWVTNRKLGLLFEARVAEGKLLVCGIELSAGMAQDPVGRQFLSSLLRYGGSSAFQPAAELTSSWIDELFGAGNLRRP